MGKAGRGGFGSRRSELEEAFFGELDQKLLQAIRDEAESKEKRRALIDASGITDPEVLDHLVELDLCSETVAALSLIPLIEVAWADGKVDAKERDAIITASEQTGLEAGHPGHDLLERWLEKKPEPRLLSVWKAYVAALTDSLDEASRTSLKEDIIGRARTVAKAAGGLLGFGNRISKAEQAMLDELEGAF